MTMQVTKIYVMEKASDENTSDDIASEENGSNGQCK